MYIQSTKRKVFKLAQKVNEGVKTTAIKTESMLNDKSGQLAADHAGWIAVAFVLVGVALYFTYPLYKDTVLPAMKEKFMGFLNYNG